MLSFPEWTDPNNVNDLSHPWNDSEWGSPNLSSPEGRNTVALGGWFYTFIQGRLSGPCRELAITPKDPQPRSHLQAPPQHLQSVLAWKEVWLFSLLVCFVGWKEWRYRFGVMGQWEQQGSKKPGRKKTLKMSKEQAEIFPSHQGNCQVEQHATWRHRQIPPGIRDSQFPHKGYHRQTSEQHPPEDNSGWICLLKKRNDSLHSN